MLVKTVPEASRLLQNSAGARPEVGSAFLETFASLVPSLCVGRAPAATDAPPVLYRRCAPGDTDPQPGRAGTGLDWTDPTDDSARRRHGPVEMTGTVSAERARCSERRVAVLLTERCGAHGALRGSPGTHALGGVLAVPSRRKSRKLSARKREDSEPDRLKARNSAVCQGRSAVARGQWWFTTTHGAH